MLPASGNQVRLLSGVHLSHRACVTIQTQIKTSCVERFQHTLCKRTTSPPSTGEEAPFALRRHDPVAAGFLKCRQQPPTPPHAGLATLQSR